MKRVLTLFIILVLIACSDGFNYETTAIYNAEASNLTVTLVAKGYILNGHDLDEDGVVNGYISSPKFKDTLYFQANEYHFLALSNKANSFKSINSKAVDISLTDYLDSIGYKDYDTIELKEFENIIKATAYGPKGTYMKDQTDVIKVVKVDFDTY